MCFALGGCLSDATAVLVVVNSNAPTTDPVQFRAWVREGAELATGSGDAAVRWSQGAGREATVAETFTVIPKAGGARDGTFSVYVEASASGLVVGRTVRSVFTPRRGTTLRVALNFDCGLPAVGCRDLRVACTVQRLCEERGQSCGETGRCVSIDVPTEEIDAGVDGATLTVPPRMELDSGVYDARDAALDAVQDGPDATTTDARADVCVRSCSGRMCGPDGCGGSCGSCPGGQSCNGSGQCVAGCTPNCTGRNCGSDGCGGSCGNCPGGQSCNGSGQCVCAPNCGGRACGPDGCGGSCGSCAAPRVCNGSGQCVCTPDCAGKRCGPDGCGGSCGTCPTGLLCNAAGTACYCPAGCSGSSSDCRDRCGYSNTSCQGQCVSPRRCNLSTGNCD
jgi:hypothetical protein